MPPIGRLVLVMTLSLFACGEQDAAEAPRPTATATTTASAAPVEGTPGYPSAMAVIGHSGNTGQGTDPDQLEADARENAWAAGTNPEVKSVYLRILEKNPAIEGRAENLAQGGATNSELLGQAEQAAGLDPKPDLVIVSAIDNDIVCPHASSDLESFGEGFSEVLQTLADGLPDAKIFLTGMFGRPTDFGKGFDETERLAVSGDGPCDLFDSDGKRQPKRIARLVEAMDAYEARAAEACAAIDPCTYDDGAFAAVQEKPSYVAEDLNHLSIAGHRKAAAVAWEALVAAGLVPPD